MAITKLNSQAIPPNTIVESDLSYPLTNFSSTGIDDNATSTAITIDSSGNIHGTGNFLKLEDVATRGFRVAVVNSTNGRSDNAINISAGDASSGEIRFGYGANNNAFVESARIRNDGGICFNGDTAAANALDDYEEGTFTCTLRDDTGNTSTSTTSRYTKIGDIVHVFFDMGNMSTSGLNAGERIRITMPFTSGDDSFGAVKLDRIAFSTSGYVICRIPTGSGTVILTQSTNGGFDSDLLVSAINVSGGSDINGQITYKVS